MSRKKTEIDLDSLLTTEEESAEKASVEAEPATDIKEEELVVAPAKEEPLQTFAKPLAQPFNSSKEDAPRGVGGSYYIDATGTRVKR